MSRISMTVSVEYSAEPNPWPEFAPEYQASEFARRAAVYSAENRVKFAMQTAIANLLLPIRIESVDVKFHEPALVAARREGPS